MSYYCSYCVHGQQMKNDANESSEFVPLPIVPIMYMDNK